MDVMQLIMDQLDRIEASQANFQAKTTDQLSQMNARLSVVEHDIKELHRRMDIANGCRDETKDEINELQSAVKQLETRHWSRGDKIKAIGIALSAVFAMAALIVSIVCH